MPRPRLVSCIKRACNAATGETLMTRPRAESNYIDALGWRPQAEGASAIHRDLRSRLLVGSSARDAPGRLILADWRLPCYE